MTTKSWLSGRVNTKLLPHHHTGKLRSHQHTSYGGLFVIIVLVMLPIVFAQRSVSAATEASSGYDTYAVIPSVVPTTAPTIANIPEGKVFTSSDSLNVTGTCQGGMQIKVFKNGVLAGSTLCKSGTYNLDIVLFIGSNILTARAYNVDGIAGPESSSVTVRLTPKNAAANAATTINSQFFLSSDAYYRGTSSGKAVSWLVTLSGGDAPYVVKINWGDGQSEQVGRGTAGQFKISHIYKDSARGGNYTVVLQGQDGKGQTALLQLIAVVPAGGAAALSSGTGGSSWFTTRTAIQAVTTIAVVIVSFWIGERYELRLLKRQQLTGAGV